MLDESELLRQYVETGSEPAFRTLVDRHCGLVYQAALRQLGSNPSLAEDVTQSVFILLAQKARSLIRHPNVAGWLFATTHFVSIRTARAEHRRRLREAAAQDLAEADLPAASTAADWARVRPALDGAILALGREDRHAIILRYFQNRAVADVARSLRVTEAAAYKRLERAVDRLRTALAQRGVTSSASALSLLIAEQAHAGAPVGMASAVAGKALSAASTAGASAVGLLQLMGIAKTTAGLIGLTAILCLPGLGVALYERHLAQRDAAELAIATRAYVADQAQLTLLKRKAVQANNAQSQLRARIEALNRSARNPKADAQKFLATFPQARGLLTRMLEMGYSSRFAAFYRSAGLSPAQIAQLENRAVELWIHNLELMPGTITSGTNLIFLPQDQLRQILGDQACQQFQDYQRAESAHSLASQVAVEVASSGSPLSASQTDQLAAIVAANSPEYQRGQTVNLATIDWQSVQTQAKAVMPEPIWIAAQSAILATQSELQYRRALAQASRKSAPAAAAAQ